MQLQRNTNLIMKTITQKLVLSLTASILAAGTARAYDVSLSTNLPPVDFHGFLSQGFLYSDDYNYLGDSKQGTFGFTEMGLNAAINPFPRTRIAVQGFDFDTGNVNQYHPFLDYALAEYTFNDEIGVRAGRIRRPAGIYNAIQDIDLARTFVLLPQGMYDARWRDWSAGLDGGELFGSLPLGKAGSLAYEGYAGLVNMSDNGGVARYIEDGLSPGVFNSIDSTPTFGGQLWYNTPLDGLRVGASFTYMNNFGYTITEPGPLPIHSQGNVPMQQYSAEYMWRSWTFQAEFYTYDFTGHEYLPTMGNAVIGSAGDNPQTWYAAASYRFNKYFEAGAYYTQFRDFAWSKPDPDGHQNDTALSLRFDLKSWWIFKIEGHAINGTGLLRDSASNPVTKNNDWFMLAVKTTFSF